MGIPQEILETIDTTRVEIPTRLRLPQNRTDQIRAFIREELSRASEMQGHETFDEADDIEPDDEEEMPYSAYELRELEPPAPLQNGVAPTGAAPDDPAPKSEVPGSALPPEEANVKK